MAPAEARNTPPEPPAETSSTPPVPVADADDAPPSSPPTVETQAAASAKKDITTVDTQLRTALGYLQNQAKDKSH